MHILRSSGPREKISANVGARMDSRTSGRPARPQNDRREGRTRTLEKNLDGLLWGSRERIQRLLRFGVVGFDAESFREGGSRFFDSAEVSQ